MTQELLRDNSLPYAEFIQRPGETIDYAIEWAGWLANRWSAGASFAVNFEIRPRSSTGFQYSSSGGYSGAIEPTWPTTIGGTVTDGSITWTCAAIDTTSLASTISSSTWAPGSPLTVGTATLTGTNATGFVTAGSGTADGDYYVRNTVTLASGVVKAGLLLIRIRASAT